MNMDLPPMWQETIVCAIDAATRHGVPLNVVLAVAEVEGGRPGMARVNNDGSVDYGRMQINSRHLQDLGAYGITAESLMQPGCYSVDLGTWIIANHIRLCRDDEFWFCVAKYHSKTPSVNARYRTKLLPAAAKWAAWVKQRMSAVEFQWSRKENE